MVENLLKTGFASYVLAAVLTAIPAGRKIKWKDRLALACLSAGFIFHSLMIGMRWYAAGRPPFASMYESLVLFSWAVVAVYFIFTGMYRAKILLA
ncbi:MAG: hypothetical protein MUC52_03190, partial [Candidatus Omnitrophica bacterium]|nr:hypothetical protein [Candidatus Omnitrophota bacterium]